MAATVNNAAPQLPQFRLHDDDDELKPTSATAQQGPQQQQQPPNHPQLHNPNNPFDPGPRPLSPPNESRPSPINEHYAPALEHLPQQDMGPQEPAPTRCPGCISGSRNAEDHHGYPHEQPRHTHPQQQHQRPPMTKEQALEMERMQIAQEQLQRQQQHQVEPGPTRLSKQKERSSGLKGALGLFSSGGGGSSANGSTSTGRGSKYPTTVRLDPRRAYSATEVSSIVQRELDSMNLETYEYIEQCETEIARLQHRELRYRELRDTAKREYAGLETYARQRDHELNSTINSLRAELRDQKKKYEELMVGHATAVIGMGTGLESISDDTFEKKISGLQTLVRELCRKPSQGRTINWDADVLRSPVFRKRVPEGFKKFEKDECFFANNHLMQTVTWMYLEENVFRTWYPNIPGSDPEAYLKLENLVRGGDKTTDQEKGEYWRALTCSLLHQNTPLRDEIHNSPSALQPHIAHLHSHYTSIFGPEIIPRIPAAKLQDVISTAITIAAEMRCQRGQYVIDDWLVPGDIYKCDKMTEWTQKEGVLDLEGNAKVELVISRRWLRMKWRGADRWEGKMGKGLVLVRVPEEEDEEEEEGGKGKEKEDVIEVDSEYEAEPKKGKVGKLVDV